MRTTRVSPPTLRGVGNRIADGLPTDAQYAPVGPRSSDLEGIRSGVSVLPLQPPAPVRRILLVRMADHALTPAAQTFAGLLRESAAVRTS